jgi:OOP family OmpA-OmpF porin
MFRKKDAAIYFSLALALPVAAQAQETTPDLLVEPYLGVGYGAYDLEFSSPAIDDDDDFSDDADAWRIYGGTHITESIALELSWYEFDDAEDEGDADTPAIQTELDGWSIAALFNAPVHQAFDLFAKVGWFWWDSDDSLSVAGAPVGSRSDDGNDVFFGVGARVEVTDVFDVRLEYDRFELDSDVRPDLDYAAVSVQYNF